MKVVATQDGVVIKLTDIEVGMLMKLTHDTPYSTRAVFEIMAQVWTANFYEDVKSAIEILDEQALDKEATA